MGSGEVYSKNQLTDDYLSFLNEQGIERIVMSDAYRRSEEFGYWETDLHINTCGACANHRGIACSTYRLEGLDGQIGCAEQNA